MANPLDGAFERVTRASEHIDGLAQEIKKYTLEMERAVLNGLELNNLRFTLDSVVRLLDPHVQPNFVVPLRYGVLVGETVYNLRAALDYLVYELARHDFGTPQEHTQFPITETAKKFVWRGAEEPIEGVEHHPRGQDRKSTAVSRS